MSFRLSNQALFMILFSIFFMKIFLFFLIKMEVIIFSFGGSSDSEYYHAYALGRVDIAPNLWPIILRELNIYGLYNRDLISYIFLILNLTFIPCLLANLSGIKFSKDQKSYLLIFILILAYPTLYFYTFDVYRDFFMVTCFLVACFFVKKMQNSPFLLIYFFWFSLVFFTIWFLFLLRPYLGYAFLVSVFLYKIKFTKKRIILFFIIYLILLFFANYLGFFDRLTEYREIFEESLKGGSNLGLDFSNPIVFLPNFILSTLGQLFGFYIVNSTALILFFIETIPIIYMLNYIFKNIRYADSFVRFLLIFFVIYASVWLIGNDNLGTAVRLRLYNYLVVYIAFFYILKLKYSSNFISKKLVFKL